MKKIEWPVSAINADGHVLDIKDIGALNDFASRHGRWGNNHVIVCGRFDFEAKQYVLTEVYSEWVVRDFFGRKVTYQDFDREYDGNGYYVRYNARQAEVRAIAAKGLPIPGTGGRRGGWKHNATAKKNSGRGHFNRNMARAIEDQREYGVKNTFGNRPHSWWW